MAKRKRLTPAQPDHAFQAEDAALPRLSSSRPFDPVPLRAAPIAQVAGDVATHAALEAVTAELQAARAEGRLIQALPLASIDATYLVRDRLIADEAELQPLIDSLRVRGQQTPIEVVALGDGQFGLISGWRRLTALKRLLAETGESRFATVHALPRMPADAAEAYVSMVEENEIRVGLSYYERARIVAKSVEVGVFPSPRAALQGLFASASRARRSKIGSFLEIVGRLDGSLRFPTALGERAGLVLARALEERPTLAEEIIKRLGLTPPRTSEDELALILGILPGAAEPIDAGEGASSLAPSTTIPTRSRARAAARPPEQVAPDIYVDFGGGAAPRITLSGPGITEDFHARLADWLRVQH